MKKIVVTIGLSVIFGLGSLAAIAASGSANLAGTTGTAESSTVPAQNAERQLIVVNEKLYPDDAVVDDVLCDGMTRCIHLSAPASSALP